MRDLPDMHVCQATALRDEGNTYLANHELIILYVLFFALQMIFQMVHNLTLFI